jgi:hypothetical protein
MTDKFEVPIGTTVIFKKEATLEIIKCALKMWQIEYPNEVIAFGRQVLRKREQLHTQNGMSKGGCFREVLEMPMFLHKIFTGMFKDSDYLKDKGFLRELKYEAPYLFATTGNRGGAGV